MSSDGDTFSRLDRFRSWEAEHFLDVAPAVNENEDLEGQDDILLFRVFSVWTLAKIILPALLYASLFNTVIILVIFLAQVIF